jgi:hypothetical protein
MATVDERALAAQDVTLQRRVKFLAISAAIQISAEASNTENHANRANLSRMVLNYPDTYAPRFAEAVMAQVEKTNPADVTDTEIETAISGAWNAYAGISTDPVDPASNPEEEPVS